MIRISRNISKLWIWGGKYKNTLTCLALELSLTENLDAITKKNDCKLTIGLGINPSTEIKNVTWPKKKKLEMLGSNLSKLKSHGVN